MSVLVFWCCSESRAVQIDRPLLGELACASSGWAAMPEVRKTKIGHPPHRIISRAEFFQSFELLVPIYL